MTPTSLIDAVREKVLAHSERGTRSDDITMVALNKGIVEPHSPIGVGNVVSFVRSTASARAGLGTLQEDTH